MRILVKAVLCLLVVGLAAVVGYAVLSDLPAPKAPVELPVNAK